MAVESIHALRHQLQEAEHALLHMRDQLRTAQERAEHAEKSARHAWAFARTVMRRPSTGPNR